jgi:hypothetical protein
MIDNLITCPCERKSNACYINEVQNTPIKTFQCYGCGFMSNTLMKEGEQFLNEQLEILPELYKDLMWEDNDGKLWMPSYTSGPNSGTVFAMGISKANWRWGATKSIDILEEEKHKYPIPNKPGEFYKKRADMSTLKTFDKYDFIEALDYVGVFPEQ